MQCLGGIYDSFKEKKETIGDGKKWMMFWELFFLWPCICGSEYAETYMNNGYFDDIFKGTAAQSFRDFVKNMGHTESTYPYHDTGNVVLKFWKGPNFKNREGGTISQTIPSHGIRRMIRQRRLKVTMKKCFLENLKKLAQRRT